MKTIDSHNVLSIAPWDRNNTSVKAHVASFNNAVCAVYVGRNNSKREPEETHEIWLADFHSGDSGSNPDWGLCQTQQRPRSARMYPDMRRRRAPPAQLLGVSRDQKCGVRSDDLPPDRAQTGTEEHTHTHSVCCAAGSRFKNSTKKESESWNNRPSFVRPLLVRHNSVH
jgi:hypothetical protein